MLSEHTSDIHTTAAKSETTVTKKSDNYSSGEEQNDCATFVEPDLRSDQLDLVNNSCNKSAVNAGNSSNVVVSAPKLR